MVLSCLTIYAIVFSCCTLLIGKSFATTPVPVEVSNRQSYKRGKLSKSPRELKVLQSSYLPVHHVAHDTSEIQSHNSARALNESHAFFALFDPANNVTKKAYPTEQQTMGFQIESVKSVMGDVTGREREDPQRRRYRHHHQHPWDREFKGQKVQNFVAWDTLDDSEKEVRVHYNGITAKETAISTGVDETTGKK
ncbi:hypothetical protein RUM43_006525 [Polyplax serrata]|uniref:Uncharacterized protein n=1 Tax=Polyplax serrata TaxID=468196 RepID=A0AAN8P1G3_POLSC